MGVLLQGFFKVAHDKALPSPADGKPNIPWWWDHLAAQARALSRAGFTAVWLPPVLKTESGSNPGAEPQHLVDDDLLRALEIGIMILGKGDRVEWREAD